MCACVRVRVCARVVVGVELLGGGGPESIGWWEGLGAVGSGWAKAPGGPAGRAVLAVDDSGSGAAVEMGTGCRADGRRGTSERAIASEHNERFGVNRGRGCALLAPYFSGRG